LSWSVGRLNISSIRLNVRFCGFAEEFIQDDSVALVLGDNIFYGEGLVKQMNEAFAKPDGATIFGYYVQDPERYGVAEFDDNQNVVNIEEKPTHPKSNYAITGLYIYDNNVIEIARALKPSKRGELEITDINKEYLNQNKLDLKILGRGTAWLDTGTYDSLLDAGQFVQTIERRQGLKIACIEEIAFQKGFITATQLETLASKMTNSAYGQYLLQRSSNKFDTISQNQPQDHRVQQH